MTDHRNTRRRFMAMVGGTVGSFAGGPWLRSAAAPDGQNAGLVVLNVKIYIVDSRVPKAEAFAVKGGRVTAVWTTAKIRELIGKATRTYNVRQMTIVPGFIDCHNHAPGNTLLYEVIVGNQFVVEFVTISSIVGKLRAKAHETPPGLWVEGYFFDDTKMKDDRALNVHDLDQVSKDRPLAVHHRGGSTVYEA